MKTIRTMIEEAAAQRQRITIQTDDGAEISGIVELFQGEPLKLRQDECVLFVPIREIEDVR